MVMEAAGKRAAGLALIASALLASCRTTPSIKYLYPDLGPFLDSELHAQLPVADRFPELRVTVARVPAPGAEGEVVERIQGFVFRERNPGWPWQVSIRIDVFRDGALAETMREMDCGGEVRAGVDGSILRADAFPGGSWCASPMFELRRSPAGWCLPSGAYRFFLSFRKGPLLIWLGGTSTDPTPVDPLIEDIARRLEGGPSSFVYSPL